jgi:ribonuclease VapC
MRIVCIRQIDGDTRLLDRFLLSELTETVAFDGVLEAIAADAFDRFGKGRHPAGLNFGDCIAYALAKSRNLPLLFKGNDFSRTDILAHPASQGAIG